MDDGNVANDCAGTLALTRTDFRCLRVLMQGDVRVPDRNCGVVLAEVCTDLSSCCTFMFIVLYFRNLNLKVGKRTSAGPAILKRLYSYIALVELDSAVIAHPVCYDAYPFAKELQFFVGSLILSTALLLLLQAQRGPCVARQAAFVGKGAALIGRGLMTLMVLLYPLLANMALTMVNCTTLAGKYVLSASTSFECYKGDHIVVGVLAWPVLALHVFGFPIATLVYLLRCVLVVIVLSSLSYCISAT